MKTKNFKLIQAIFENGLTNVDVVRRAEISSESRLSRIIGYQVLPTIDEINRIAALLGTSPGKLGFSGSKVRP